MKKILALAVLAGALSGCIITIDGGVTTPTISNVSLASRFVRNDNGGEFYICGNKEETVSVSIDYSGSLSSFRIDLVGELNPGKDTLKYGTFNFGEPGEGDTSGNVTRRLVIKTSDIKPNASEGARTQAVIVTPVPIPAPASNEVGIGGIFAEVTMTSSTGSVTKKSSAVVRLLTEASSRCK